MGLCPSLSELQTARPGAALLHAPLQLASTSCQYRTNAAHLQTRPDRGQPVETPQLAVRRRNFSLAPRRVGGSFEAGEGDLGAVGDAELAHNLADMNLYGSLANS